MKSFEILLGDITVVHADAIVNAANTSLLGGGGVDGAIHRAAGPRLLEACRALHGCGTGQAKITRGFRLPATYVIHTPGPIWCGGHHQEAELLRHSYENSLKLAERYRCRTVAFPSISTGVYHFPLDQAAGIAVRVIRQFLLRSHYIEHILMVCFDAITKQAYLRAAAFLIVSEYDLLLRDYRKMPDRQIDKIVQQLLDDCLTSSVICQDHIKNRQEQINAILADPLLIDSFSFQQALNALSCCLYENGPMDCGSAHPVVLTKSGIVPRILSRLVSLTERS